MVYKTKGSLQWFNTVSPRAYKGPRVSQTTWSVQGLIEAQGSVKLLLKDWLAPQVNFENFNDHVMRIGALLYCACAFMDYAERAVSMVTRPRFAMSLPFLPGNSFDKNVSVSKGIRRTSINRFFFRLGETNSISLMRSTTEQTSL